MPFQVTARTILQLGAELISSDAIAFYELIKNAFDAGSPKVEVRVVSRLTATTCRHILNGCDEFERSSDEDESKWQLLVQFALANLNFDALEANDLKQSLERAKNPMELRTAIEEANFIQFSDTGEGMSLQDLQEIYLTIGTTSRREQRKKAQESPSTSTKGTQSRRPILGEKGLGRLSVMRLGDGLRVETSKAGETHFNVLEVDWSIFSNDSGALLNSIEITPFIGHKKPDKASSGTKIRIFNLHADWDHQKLEDVARDELSKFTDPFSRENRSFIILWFNNEPVIIPNMNKRLFEHAHAFVQAVYDLDTNGVPYLRGHIDYRFTKRQKSFEIEGAHLSSIAGVPLETLVSLGSFSLQFYWFNNLILRAIEGIGSMQEVRNLVKRWAGGLMVFRDGFRVYPYGGLDDDWLKIDPDALAAAGYKVNRRQIIGKVDISSIHNPALVDQTSREGLRDSPEKQALIILLRHILGTEFRGFLNKVEQDRLTNDPMDLEELEGRLGQRER
ncbi:MAG: ATP-binding protein, partial [Abitibacteriaceae bacterium]|nr:ATP-binding protein [Abditibacteriaceae bacterium]